MNVAPETELNKLLGIPTEYRVKGRLVRLHPTTLADHALIEREILSKRTLNPIKEAADACEGLEKDDPERQMIYKMAFDMLREREVVSVEQFTEYCTSLPGLSYRVYLALRKDYPEITREESDEIFEELFNKRIAKMVEETLRQWDGLDEDEAREVVLGKDLTSLYREMSDEFSGEPTTDPTNTSEMTATS